MNRKHSFLTIITMLFISVSLMGCEKQVCSYCGQEAYCDEYDILGTTRYICDNCLGNPYSTLSGNVITDYESDLVDPSLYAADAIESYNQLIASSVPSASENNIPASSNTVLDQTDVMPAPAPIPEDPAPVINDNNSVDNTPNININTQGKDSVISGVATRLSTHSMYLMPQDDTDTVFSLYLNDQYTNIDFDFTGSTQSKAVLCISKKSGASDNDFTASCIDASLGFIGSGDYSGEGYTIFNNAFQYGNYTYSGTRFYYTPSSDKEISDGGPLIRYEISYQ